jgi:hypothetical protein
VSRRRLKRNGGQVRAAHVAAEGASRAQVIVREATRVERLAYTRTQAADALGVSRSTFNRRVLPLIETVAMPWARAWSRSTNWNGCWPSGFVGGGSGSAACRRLDGTSDPCADRHAVRFRQLANDLDGCRGEAHRHVLGQRAGRSASRPARSGLAASRILVVLERLGVRIAHLRASSS